MNREGYKIPTAETVMSNVEKPWNQVTAQERNENKKNKCRHCRYSNRWTNGNDVSTIVCDYIGITGHMRGCSPINCDKFEKRTRKKRSKKNE